MQYATVGSSTDSTPSTLRVKQPRRTKTRACRELDSTASERRSGGRHTKSSMAMASESKTTRLLNIACPQRSSTNVQDREAGSGHAFRDALALDPPRRAGDGKHERRNPRDCCAEPAREPPRLRRAAAADRRDVHARLRRDRKSV